MNSMYKALAIAACASLLWAGLAAAQDQDALEDLGKRVFFDNISNPPRQACATCHVPANGWTAGVAAINLGQVAVTGANPHTVGGRKPPSAAYAHVSPDFGERIPDSGLCAAGLGRLCIGGVFWDGRADGTAIGDEVFDGDLLLQAAYQQFLGPTADQALGPFPNDVEQNVPNGNDGGLPGAEAVCRHVEDARYAELFEFAWNEPIDCEPDRVALSFKRIAVAISAFEHSDEVNSFSSKRDMALLTDDDANPGEFPLAGLTAEENQGHDLFYGITSQANPSGKNANCALCHNSEGPGSLGDELEQLYSDQAFHDLGLPPNFEIANFDPNNPDVGLEGFTGNPGHKGDFRTPTMRNVDKRVGAGFPKAYMHNGYFKNLEDVVHFYNTASLKEDPVACPAGTTAAEARANDCWPSAELPGGSARGAVFGDLGLTEAEEAAIVAYLKTLSDTETVTQPLPYH
ncbi:MAG: hypothetical protein OXR73_33955 [Myxococcales bacterium]|nr:hypothetical protein [Myxococcales bacterium]